MLGVEQITRVVMLPVTSALANPYGPFRPEMSAEAQADRYNISNHDLFKQRMILSSFEGGRKHAKGYQRSLDTVSLENQTNLLTACIGRR
jgi:hypothetical protein